MGIKNKINEFLLLKTEAEEYQFLVNLPPKEYPKFLKLIYKCRTGKKLHLKNPKDLNEKIQWLKLYDNIPIKSVLTDKIAVRNWIKDKIGEKYLKNVLGVWEKAEDVEFASLPDKFVIKVNHSCGQNVLINNKNKILENKKNYEQYCNRINGWLTYKFAFCAGFELQYIPIKPLVFAEEFLPDIKNMQIYCFNGEPRIIDIHKTIEQKGCFYDINHKLLPYYYQPINSNAQRQNIDSEFFDETVNLSKILAKDFKFVRVDFAISNDKLYFEEMTFTPWSGFGKFEDKKAMRRWGNLLKLK